MDKTSDRIQRSINWTLYFSIVFVLSHMLGIGITLTKGILHELVVVASAAIIAKYILYNPISLYFASVATVFGSLIANRYFNDALIGLYSWLIGLSDNIINNIMGRENILTDYQLPFIFILAFMISMLTASVVFKGKSILILLPHNLFAYIMYWYSFRNEALWLLAAFLVLFLMLLSNRAFMPGKRESFQNPNSSAEGQLLRFRTGAKYSVLIVVIALLLPKTDRHLKFPWLEAKVNETFPFVEDLRSTGEGSRGVGEARGFDFSVTGFQSDGSRLGGPVKQRSDQVMTVKSSRSLYLRGNVKQIYTGESWEAIAEPSNIYRLGDDISGVEENLKDLLYDRVEALITFRDFSSTTLFSPLSPEKLNSFQSKAFIMGKDGYLVIPGGLYDGESYYLSALVPKPYGIALANGANETLEELDDIELYLSLPGSITQRTLELTNSIIEGMESPYEKAAAIEEYLRTSYTYRLDVGQVPEEIEFVDYFLFDGKEGYCTYYASAMTVMLRIADIPSRYVEGFIARGPADEGVYSVTYNNAHSWVEAFIEPVGWMTFEPTPALPLPLRLEDYSPDEYGTTDPNSPESFGRDPDDMGMSDELVNEDTEGDLDVTNADFYIIFSLSAAVILLAVLPGQLILGFMRYQRRKRSIESMGPQDKIIHYYDDIVDMLGILGYPSLSGETHSDHAKRIAYKFNDINGSGILKISDAFVKAKYGDIAPDNDMIKTTLEFLHTLEDKARKDLGKPRFLYLKYIKGIKDKGR